MSMWFPLCLSYVAQVMELLRILKEYQRKCKAEGNLEAGRV